MYALLGVIGILFVACILEAFFNVPTIGAVRGRLERLFIGHGYTRFFLLTGLFAVVTYGIGEALMAPFLGLYNAGTEIGTLFLVIFLGGMVRAIFSGVGDAVLLGRKVLTGVDRRKNSEFSVFSSTIFVTGAWGCVILLTFYNHAVSGALLSVRVL